MGKLVKSKYAEALEISRQNGTQAMLEEEFSSYGVRGSTHRKAVGFFLAAAKLGGIEVSGHFHTPRRIQAQAVTAQMQIAHSTSVPNAGAPRQCKTQMTRMAWHRPSMPFVLDISKC